MKKFLLSLAGLALAFAANAADYYLIGGFNNWTTKDATCKFTEGADGLYTLDYDGTLTSGFKINDGTWANDAANWGGSTTLQVGVPYTLTVGGSSGNITLEDNIEKPHLVFNPTEGILTITGQEVAAEYTYAIWGQIFSEDVDPAGGLAWTQSDFTEVNGKWTLTADCFPGEFGIQKIDKATGKSTEWISWDNATTPSPEFGQPIAMKVEGENLNLVEGGECTFTFDADAMTLTVTGEGSFGEVEPSYYLAGTFTDWVENSEAFKFEKDENGLYVYDMEADLIAGNDDTPEAEFKITNGSWFVAFGSNGESLEEGTAYICSADASADNITVAATITEPHFVFNPETLTLTITSRAGGEDDPVESDIHYYIRGDIFTGTWSDEEMTLTNGKYVLADKEVEAGNFGIKVANLAITEGDNQIAWYSALTEPEVKLNTPIELTDEDGKNLSISKGKYTFTLDLEAMTLTVTGEEIEDVDPVYAYSLYGPNTAGGSWDDNLMTEGTDGKWTVTLEKPLVEFGIRYVDTAHNNKQEGWYSSADEDPAITDFGKYSVKEGGKNWTSTLTEPATYTFDPEAMTLTIDKGSSVGTIVAEEGDAVYFNLQGVRVANPENGMYIRVVNGKAQKVVK
ncbi:MAG: hypothetical protein K2M63_03175 [Muribaculaceae bacterium]|nr:hypothetical protein [Muribaculaceae bacterium]